MMFSPIADMAAGNCKHCNINHITLIFHHSAFNFFSFNLLMIFLNRIWYPMCLNIAPCLKILLDVGFLTLVSLRFFTLYATATWIPFKISLLWLIQQWGPIVFFCHLRCRVVQRDKSQTHYYHHGYLLNVHFENNGREYNCGLKPVNMFIRIVDTWIISRDWLLCWK